jgi:hypothetical protein
LAKHFINITRTNCRRCGSLMLRVQRPPEYEQAFPYRFESICGPCISEEEANTWQRECISRQVSALEKTNDGHAGVKAKQGKDILKIPCKYRSIKHEASQPTTKT